MKWFRSRAKRGACLALLALAVQFVLSFGHFHWDAAQAAPAINAVAAKSTLAPVDRSEASVPPAVKSAQPQPASNRPADRHPHEICGICAVMAMAGSAMFTEPPLLMLPQAYHFLYLAIDAEFSHLATPRADFQPRAPPAS